MAFVLFPGLGADARLYGPQLAAFPLLQTPEWTSLAPGGALADFAARIIDATPGLAFANVIGGSSFGGMVACDIQPRALRASG